MRYRGPEQSYIAHLDWEKGRVPGQGKAAEEAVISFFQSNFPRMEVRPATPQEDSGKTGFGDAKMLDAIVYRNEAEKWTPAMGLQVTTNLDQGAKQKKFREMKDMPFVRLEEMKRQDVSIPRVLVFLEPKEVKVFSEDKDFARHPRLTSQILESTINSLKFDLAQTKSPDEQRLVKNLLEIVEAQKQKLSKKNEQGRPN